MTRNELRRIHLEYYGVKLGGVPEVLHDETHLFRIPGRVTNKWLTETVNGIIARKCENPASVTNVETRGSGWKKSDAGFMAQCREYIVTIETCDGRKCRKVVELTKGGGIHRLNLQRGFDYATS